MNYAGYNIARLGLVGLMFLLSGCIAFERTSGAGNTGRQVLFQTQYSAYYELQEISQFTKIYEGLSDKQLGLLLVEVKDDFTNQPSMLNRYKLILLQAYSDKSTKSVEQVLSLIRDGNLKGDSSERSQSEHFLAFLGKQYSRWLQENKRLNQKIHSLGSKHNELEKKNQKLKDKLSESEVEREKIKRQLTLLKSIETSIIQRDMDEGTVTP
ncbi:MAG: hypothetical protein GXP14_11710 [Gammaproteobacteria bacterium]|nr:hypothetical protein [Gammaproteobacteria bacterium]